MNLTLIIFSIFISYIDLKSHRIPNKIILIALIVFSVLTLLLRGSFYPENAILTLVFSPLLLKLRIGAGDIKLFAMLSAFFLPLSLATAVEFSAAFSIIAALLMVRTVFKQRTLHSNIALAPAICGAFIWCAR